MLRSRQLFESRRYFQSIAASCFALSIVVESPGGEDLPIIKIDSREKLSRFVPPSASVAYCHGAFTLPGGFTLKRQKTVEALNKTANHEKTVDSVYEILWDNPVGVGKTRQSVN